ncbi:hypothetical protein LXL04_021208 [Taraxacum kok-saghyz]
MGSRGRDDEQQARVTRRNKRPYGQGWSQRGGVGNSNQVSDHARSFYFTNFPLSITVNDVWRVCSRLGRVVDVYISPYLSKLGKRFGFVRYVDVPDDQKIVAQMNDIWFGYYKLFASLPRYSKPDGRNPRMVHDKQPRKPSVVHVKQPRPIMYKVKSTVEKRHGDSMSYANVLSGKPSGTSKVKDVVDMELQSGDFVITDGSSACLAKARDFLTLPNLRLLCMDEGFEDVDLDISGTCSSFLNNDSMDHWLSEKRQWDRIFVVMERIVWLDVEGLPIRAWSKGAFRQIVSKLGVVMQLDDDLGEDVYKNRICVLSSHQNIISETLNIRVDGMMFVVRWTPTFSKGEPKLDNLDKEEVNLYEEEVHEETNDNNDVTPPNQSAETSEGGDFIWISQHIHNIVQT